MRLTIKQCTHCPIKGNCEHRNTLRAESRKALVNITVQHNCKVYPTLFPLNTKVSLFVWEESGEPMINNGYGKSELLQGVVIHVPKSGKSRFGVALFEPYELPASDGDTKIIKVAFVRANQMTAIGTYKGSEFWKSDLGE